MKIKHLLSALIVTCACLPATAQNSGTAIVEVISVPDLGGDTVRFHGTPNGTLELRLGQADRLIATGLASGTYLSKITDVGPIITAQHYNLESISCDDADSAVPSTGDVSTLTATFNIEPGEKVTCRFTLKAAEPSELEESPGASCICPLEGSWSVSNLPGAMVCTGSFNMSVPFPANNSQGALEISDDCETIFGTDFQSDTADVTLHRQPDCTYAGVVGGEQDGIPMQLEFTMAVENEKFLTGKIYSQVTQQGATCTINRPFEMRFNN
jgi:hypothetical protein